MWFGLKNDQDLSLVCLCTPVEIGDSQTMLCLEGDDSLGVPGRLRRNDDRKGKG